MPMHFSAWVAFLDATPASRIAAHRAAFSTSAFCKVQLILRRCGSEAELGAWSKWWGWSGMPHNRPTDFKLYGSIYLSSTRNTPEKFK